MFWVSASYEWIQVANGSERKTQSQSGEVGIVEVFAG